jgi:hypothetical protein
MFGWLWRERRCCEIENPKSESRNPKQIQSSNVQMTETDHHLWKPYGLRVVKVEEPSGFVELPVPACTTGETACPLDRLTALYRLKTQFELILHGRLKREVPLIV